MQKKDFQKFFTIDKIYLDIQNVNIKFTSNEIKNRK